RSRGGVVGIPQLLAGGGSTARALEAGGAPGGTPGAAFRAAARRGAGDACGFPPGLPDERHLRGPRSGGRGGRSADPSSPPIGPAASGRRLVRARRMNPVTTWALTRASNPTVLRL